ncbi:hypothetical protein DPMN_011250 [Dreissena polymorpha]|uniref:Uncharacterized protein n=1 Tax=Dreissena polymorpha TaxID=45954 RepID=A0A9D4RZT8_DREPO|nr:hypothetical protein DPMN_011250 [Dreissena polymorpha]
MIEMWLPEVEDRVKRAMKNAPPPWWPCFSTNRHVIGINLLTKIHEDRTVNVASRVKNFPPLGNIIGTNLLSKFHEDRKTNVASRPYMEKCHAPNCHVFKATKTIFELIQDIIGTNLLSKFHDDQKINVTSKNAPPPWWPYTIGINLLTEFHEDRTINVASRVKNAPPLGSNVFQAKVTMFKLVQDIIGTNHLTKFHEDRKINAAPRVLTRFYYSHTVHSTRFPQKTRSLRVFFSASECSRVVGRAR